MVYINFLQFYLPITPQKAGGEKASNLKLSASTTNTKQIIKEQKKEIISSSTIVNTSIIHYVTNYLKLPECITMRISQVKSGLIKIFLSLIQARVLIPKHLKRMAILCIKLERKSEFFKHYSNTKKFSNMSILQMKSIMLSYRRLSAEEKLEQRN